ncbi:MAG: leucine-rich repeat protein, partial [Atopobiaceae bacterium]|nr:leucine-rich repeat protein [Atopobiaceae bacterium]
MDAARKALSVLLSFALVFSSVPTPALAEALGEEDQDAAAAQGWVDETGETVDEGNSAEYQSPDAVDGSQDSADVQAAGEAASAVLVAQDAERHEYQDGNVRYTYAILGDNEGTPRLTILEVAVTDTTLEESSFDLVIPSSITVDDTPVPVEVLGTGSYGFYSTGAGEGGINKANRAIRSITVPASVLSVGEYFFGSRVNSQGCTNVKSIVFEEGSQVTAIPRNCFTFLTKLESITLPEGVTSIDEEAFKYCRSLATITYPDGAADGVNLPPALQTIGDRAFQDCVSFTSLTLPEGLTAIGTRAFANIDWTEYGAADNSALASVTLPNSLKTIGEQAFVKCDKLTSATFGASQTEAQLETIGKEAFEGTSLEAAILPDSVTTIAEGAFNTKSTLATVKLGSSQETSQLQTIGANAFRNAVITQIALPNSLTSLNYDCSDTRGHTYWKTPFANCTQLQSIAWPTAPTDNGFTTVGGFWDCTTLDNGVVSSIPSWVTVIDNYAFYQCAFTTAEIPSSVTTVGAYAFANNKLTKVSIPASVTSIGDYAFNGNQNRLGEITIEDGTDPLTIGDYAFRSITGEQTIKLSKRVASLGANVFGSSSNFASVSFYVYNKDIKLKRYDEAYAEADLDDPWNWSVNGTVYYPQDAAEDSDILRLKAEYADEGRNMAFVPFSASEIKTHTITGTVPEGANVVLYVDGEAKSAVWDGNTLTYEAPENSLVGVVVTLDGYADMAFSPEADKNMAKLTADWTFTLDTKDMTPLSTTGMLQVRALGDYNEDANVAVFDAAGKLVSQGRVLRARVHFVESIPAGTYDVVAWQANDYFSSISSLDDFAALGFGQDDYARTQVTLAEREVKEVELTVPALDTLKVTGILTSGDLSVANGCIVMGVTFYARVRFEMAEGHTASAVKMNIPEGMAPVSAYSPTKSYGVTGWNANDRVLTIGDLVEADQAGTTISVGLVVSEEGEHAVSATVTSGNATVPVGSAQVETQALQLVVPQGTLSSATFTAHVYANPGTEVAFSIGGTDLDVTCTTNKAGHGQAELTIPGAEMSVDPYYLVTATTTGEDPISVSETVEFSVAALPLVPTVQQFYFEHVGNRVYLVKDGVENTGVHYTAVITPSAHGMVYSPTWPVTLVIDSLQPLKDTIVLQLGMADQSVKDNVEMTLADTEELPTGAVRYTYTLDLPVGDGDPSHSLQESDIPVRFDIVPQLAQEEPVAYELSQAEVDAIKRRSVEAVTNTQTVAQDPDVQQYLEYWTEDVENYEDLGVFNRSFFHETWDPDGTIWATLTAEEKAAVEEAEDMLATAYNYLAWYLGDKKPLYEYGSMQEYLADNYGYATGVNADSAELEAQGYTVVYDEDTASVEGGGTPNADGVIVAPAWAAIRFGTQGEEDESGGTATLEYVDANGNAISVTRPVDRWANGGQVDWWDEELEPQAAGMLAAQGSASDKGNGGKEEKIDDFGHTTISSLISGTADLLNTKTFVDMIPPAEGRIGSALGLLGSIYSAFRLADSSNNQYGNGVSLDERKEELERLEWIYKYYEEHNPDSGCQQAIKDEIDALKPVINDLKNTQIVSWFDVPVSTVLTGVSGYAAAVGTFAPGTQIPAGLVFLASSGTNAVWSFATAFAYKQAAWDHDYHLKKLDMWRNHRLKMCRYTAFGKLHYKTTAKIDPSGFAYAGAYDARVEGAVAAIYQVIDGAKTVWEEAAEYDETNPQQTNEAGVFAWNVPEGDWQVGVTKEGYEEAWSDVMHVLPEWTNVAINLLFKAAPKVTDHTTDDDCTYVDVTFDIYMKVSEVPSVTIGGVAAEGATWQEPTLGRDEKDEEVQLSRTLRVPVPAGLPAGEAEVKLSGGYSYAGKSLGETSFTITIPVTPNWDRYAGDTALDTGKAVVEADKGATFAEGRGGTVIVATNDGYWDALAAAGLAGTLDAPVLITNKKNLSTQTEEEIRRLRPQRVLIMGGTAAVSDTVRGQINDLGPITERIAGDNAVKTAVEIYRAGGGWSDTAIVATSSGYWDALSVAPYAWWGKAPIFL